jgi:hypothetical protein
MEKNDLVPIFFDTEAFVSESGKHVCYCVSYRRGNKSPTFYGLNCIPPFLDDIIRTNEEKYLLIAHNVSYDVCFIFDYLDVIQNNSIIKNRQVLRLLGIYKGKKLLFKDSYAIIPKALRYFPIMFNFPEIKEIYPYRYYDIQMQKGEFYRGNKMDALSFIRPEDHESFLSNVEKINRSGYNFDMENYCKYYCERDVEILQKGYMSFREYILKQFHLDILRFLSISSIANEIMCINCYYPNENLFDLSGTPRNFIAKCIHGGRCLCKPEITEERIICLDAVSLYPSAMKRLYCLEGMPQVLSAEQCNQKYLLRHLFEDDQTIPNMDKFISGFFIQYQVISLRERYFPLLPHLEKDAIIFIDHILLEDLVKFCKIRGHVIRGYYYSGKRDQTIRNVIEEIFQLRVANKKTPIEQIMKIVLNSIYGKTILKPIKTELKFIPEQKVDDYLYRHFNNIVVAENIDNGKFTKIKEKKLIDKHRNFTPLGCNILSMSKRIMNEVFCLCEDYGIKIYYTDTDSLYVGEKDEKRIQELYEKMYGRVMEGTMLNQFHRDFPQVCTKSVFVGKKCYCNLLEDGTYHYRLKGICQDVIEKKSKEYGGLIGLYEALYNHTPIEFDLCDSDKPSIDTNNFEAFSRKTFLRKIEF